jgi:hypothetical protein
MTHERQGTPHSIVLRLLMAGCFAAPAGTLYPSHAGCANEGAKLGPPEEPTHIWKPWQRFGPPMARNNGFRCSAAIAVATTWSRLIVVSLTEWRVLLQASVGTAQACSPSTLTTPPSKVRQITKLVHRGRVMAVIRLSRRYDQVCAEFWDNVMHVIHHLNSRSRHHSRALCCIVNYMPSRCN